MRLRVRRRIRPHHRLRDRSSPLTLGEPYPELRGSEGSGLSIALILRFRPRLRPPLHSWPGLHGSCGANVTSVVVPNKGRPFDDVFEIDASGCTREAAGSAAGNNLVLASAFNL
jgi:hypothetical protein